MVHEWNGHIEIFSRPQVIENSRLASLKRYFTESSRWVSLLQGRQNILACSKNFNMFNIYLALHFSSLSNIFFFEALYLTSLLLQNIQRSKYRVHCYPNINSTV